MGNPNHITTLIIGLIQEGVPMALAREFILHDDWRVRASAWLDQQAENDARPRPHGGWFADCPPTSGKGRAPGWVKRWGTN